MPGVHNKLSQFWQELKRRRVIHVIIVYATAAAVIIGLVSDVYESLQLPERTPALVLLLLAVGFPVAIIFSWIYDISLKGIRKTESVESTRIRKEESSPSDKKIRFENSIAVLPFEDMSPQKDQEYLCDGMTEEIINALTHVESLKVIARTSSFAFKGKQKDMREIGRKLDVETLLEGSIRKDGKRLRITAQLIQVTDGSHIWSERYDREMTDVFSIQDEITVAIVDTLKIKLLGEEKAEILKHHTENLEAYNLYLKAVHESPLTTAGCARSIDYYKKALQRDPKFALAYVGLAMTYWISSTFGNIPPNEAFPKAISYVNKALGLDNSLAEAYAAIGIINTVFDWNWEKAEENFKHALELNPNSAFTHWSYSMMLMCTERFEEAITQSLIALELDPLSREAITQVGNAYHFNGQINKAIEQFQKLLAHFPDNYYPYVSLLLLYRQKLRYRKSNSMYKKAVKLAGDAPVMESIRAAAFKLSGQNKKALRILNNLITRLETEYIPSLYFYTIYRIFGENDLAFEWVERACNERDSLLPLYSVHPDKEIRIPDEPRYNDLLRKFGIRKSSN